MRLTPLLLAAPLVLGGCASIHKTCYPDGVCRVERDGVVSWEGPPDKVAARQGGEQGRAQAQAKVDEAYLQAPKRVSSEPIRLVVLDPSTEYPDLAPLATTYRQMLEQALQGDARIQLVPYAQVKLLAEARSDDGPPSAFARSEPRTAVDAALTRRLRDGGAEVDLVLVVHLRSQKTSGFVSGKGGMGVAEVNNVAFDLSLSSVYRFQEYRHTEVGKSSDSLAVAGIDKKGKTGSGELKGKRNPESDRPALVSAASWVRQTTDQQIAPDLPSLAAAREIRAQTAATALQDAPAWMKKVLAK
jgi:hypothetical protein